MRTLIIMRHAKAEASAPTDFERQLTERGLADAADAGEWLGRGVIQPELALVSAAARTTQTWESVAAAAGWDVDVAEYLDQLYDAYTDSVVEQINEVDDGIQTLMVVGHNPTMAALAQLLDDNSGVEVGDYATSAVTVFSVDADWSDLAAESATPTGFHIGRG